MKSNHIKEYQNNRFLVVSNKSQHGNYEYFSNIYSNGKNNITIILPRISLMLQQGHTIQLILNEFKGDLIVEKENEQKYILRCSHATQSKEVLQIINKLDAREDVVWCEPEFLSDYKINNPLYSQQYYLKNTGQNGGTAGVDINIEPAWNLTNGNPCITVAVIDAGVDRNHEDMGNRVLEGFTIRNANGLGVPQNVNSLNNKAHGMACAGIIAASNNTMGIRGIASNVNILPVNIVPDAAFELNGNIIQGFGSNIEIAEAINWARERADILSCSWGGGSPSNDIITAINNARTLGRNTSGCVVVFASGNNWPNSTDVAYPGSVDGVITVGAINNQGAIWDYSQRGLSMDLVAPSGNVGSGDVRTTDRMGNLGYNTSGNYTNNFGGTSAACPQVSGVAALMLSVRPDLTEAQVRTTLQQTATDMGSTGFDNTYGFGRLNAFAAIQSIYPAISNQSVACTSGTQFSINNFSSGTVTWTCTGSISCDNTNITPTTFRATGQGSGTIQAIVNLGCGNITLPAKTVWAGFPVITSISGPSSVGINQPASFTAQLSLDSSPTSYYWTTSPSSGVTIYPDSRYASMSFANSGTYQVVARAQNSCGWSDYAITYVDVSDGYSLVISPNPTTTEATIELVNTSTEKATKEIEWDLEVYDAMQSLKAKTQKIKDNKQTLSTMGWKEGVYIVRAIIGKDVISGKLVVKQ